MYFWCVTQTAFLHLKKVEKRSKKGQKWEKLVKMTKGPKRVKIEVFWPFRPFSTFFFKLAMVTMLGTARHFSKCTLEISQFFLVLRQRGRPPKRLSRIQGPKKGPTKAQNGPKWPQNRKNFDLQFRLEMH